MCDGDSGGGNGPGKPGPARRLVEKLVVKAVLSFNLIEEGDRVLVACSGGKDSTMLALCMAAARPALKVNYELAALHISSDFCSCCKKAPLSALLDSSGIPFDDIFVPVIGLLNPGRKMNCYWCSTQRRTELLKYAVAKGYNKIALGHHLDDVIETFFMNMTQKGTLETMPPALRYEKYPATLIRPLALTEERQIIAAADEAGVLAAACTCPFGANSNRKKVRAKITEFTGGSSAVKRRILRAALGGENGN
jgi:tRNA 2-thiocytidine biosynthesis protein TtcA